MLLRFDSRATLEAWMGSSERTALIGEVRPHLASGDDFFVRSGLDFWFTPDAAAKIPTHWKQALVTWSAIFPLAFGVPLFVVPALRALGLPEARALDTLAVTGVVVALMVYVVMPRYTRLVHRWLFH